MYCIHKAPVIETWLGEYKWVDFTGGRHCISTPPTVADVLHPAVLPVHTAYEALYNITRSVADKDQIFTRFNAYHDSIIAAVADLAQPKWVHPNTRVIAGGLMVLQTMVRLEIKSTETLYDPDLPVDDPNNTLILVQGAVDYVNYDLFLSTIPVLQPMEEY